MIDMIPDDRSMRANLLAKFEDFRCASLINVVVLDGVVQLWGVLTDESQRIAILAIAKKTDGVKLVEDHLMLVQPTTFATLMP